MLLLFFDWDETITAHDTLSLIPDPPASQAFSQLTDAYLTDYEAFHSHFSTSSSPASQQHTAQSYHLPPPSEAVGINSKLWDKLAYLDQIDHVEHASMQRAQQIGIFRAWSLSAAKQRAASEASVKLRHGWYQVVQWLQSDSDPGKVQLHILSVNWSTSFIQSALQFHPASNLDLSKCAYSINANEPSVDPHSQLGTGHIQGSSIGSDSPPAPPASESPARQHTSDVPAIRTGRHKLDAMRSIIKHATTKRSPESGSYSDQGDVITVYVGDSMTDLPCLLHANIGILIGNKTSVLEGLEPLGVVCVDADSCLTRLRQEGITMLGSGLGSTKAHQLVLVSDWTQAARIFQANLSSYDPFADTGEAALDVSANQAEQKKAQQDKYVHIRIQQRNGRKTVTTLQGLPKEYDAKKLLKAFKKEFACNGTVVDDPELGDVIQLQGDQRQKIAQFLVEEAIPKDTIKVHGF
ncbi:Eukaryotic translation initiation factor eIF-1 [Tilletia horrida]|uniref:Eukaryotic translation initiation factor eIF-1 n=1 Tax=Tilletia horrida TaxID=155126 RepID=A0AAN6GP20_9BASI|nr:Eukaryotic translation initiation factor eIF-1 [Tilletia horrida]KAK0552358.1 Eukaryotic translation initiation factor eIF-1 [Tilletia horrida]KAK0567176.1 Eukaryotic translation initiation factor eIF-1 [Tilletia horrida]